MAKVEVRVFDSNTKEDERLTTDKTVEVRTPSGVVHISYDDDIGAVIVVRGDKATTTVKFNEKAVV